MPPVHTAGAVCAEPRRPDAALPDPARPDPARLAVGPAASEAAAAAVLIHGRGRTPEEMRDLALALSLPAVRFVMPAAPGGIWYPKSFLAPLPENEPFLSAALACCEAAVAGLLEAGLPAERIVLGGFSQGACLAAEMLVRHPRRYGGALLFTGGLIGPPGTAWPSPPVLAGVPVLLTGGRADAWVPPARVEETGRVLAAAGAQVDLRMFDDRDHVVSPEEIEAARALLAAVAKGYGTKASAGGRAAGGSP